MDDFVRNPYVVGFVTSIFAAIIVTLAIRSWTKLRHLPHSLANHLLSLAKKFDRPTLVRNSRLNALAAASVERDALQTQLEHQTEQYRLLSDHTLSLKVALREQTRRLEEVSTTWKKTDEFLDVTVAERDALLELNSQLKNEIETLNHPSINAVTGLSGEICQIPGQYVASYDSTTLTADLQTGDMFPSPSPSRGTDQSTTWTLTTNDFVKQYMQRLKDEPCEVPDSSDKWELAFQIVLNERDTLDEQNEQLVNKNESLRSLLVGKLAGDTWDDCLVTGKYRAICHPCAEATKFNEEESFGACYGGGDNPHETTWVLTE